MVTAAAAAATAIAGPVAVAAKPDAADPPSPATGHAQVVAQTLADLPDGNHHWSIGGGVVESGGAATPPQAAARFVVATGGTLVAVDSAGSPIGNLAVGEAMPFATGYDVSLVSASDQPTTYLAVLLVDGEPPAEAPGSANPFALGAGVHDVDLVRDVLAPGEQTTLTGSSAAPMLVVVTEGTVGVTTGGAGPDTLAQGDARALAGNVDVTNTGETTATFVAAVIAPFVVPETGAATTTTTPATTPGETTAPDVTTADPGTTNAPTTEPTPTTGPPGQDGSVSIRFSPSSPPPGGTLDVSGTGCEPGETVFVSTWRTSGSPYIDTATTAGGDGAFSAATTVPDSLAPGEQFGVYVGCGGEFPADGREAYTYGNAGDRDPSITTTTSPDGDTDGDGLTNAEEDELGTNPESIDSDDDGLGDLDEVNRGTDPNIPDTDGDGLRDVDEVNGGTDPNDPDSDDDGLGDEGEAQHSTDPNNPDSDGDGLNDGDEVNVHGSDPLSQDSDGDAIDDGDEVNTYGTDPTSGDSDGDGVGDYQEIDVHGTDPNNSDSDDDGLQDGWEVNDYGTDPLDDDTDDDGFVDGFEVGYGTDPLDPNDHPPA